MKGTKLSATLLLIALGLLTACSKSSPTTSAAPSRHDHHPPHGGTPVVLGHEAYHLELVRDSIGGTFQAYLFDGEMEFFVRASVPSFEISAIVNGQPQTLIFLPVANPATGETTGDTALYTAQAEWLKTTPAFDATLKSLTIRGTTFSNVKFNFPSGNDHD